MLKVDSTVRSLKESIIVGSIKIPMGNSAFSLGTTGGTLLYTFEKHGFDPLKEEYLYALAQAVAVDLPLLQDSARYTFHTRTEIRSNGLKADWYEYMITTDYKDSMIRAEYLEKKPHRA